MDISESKEFGGICLQACRRLRLTELETCIGVFHQIHLSRLKLGATLTSFPRTDGSRCFLLCLTDPVVLPTALKIDSLQVPELYRRNLLSGLNFRFLFWIF